MKHPHVIPDITGDVRTRIYTIGNRFVYREIALAFAGKLKLPFMTVTEKFDEEFSTFADEAVFYFDSIEYSGMEGKWRIE